MNQKSLELIIRANDQASGAIQKVNVDISAMLAGFESLTKAAASAASALNAVKAPAVEKTAQEVKEVAKTIDDSFKTLGIKSSQQFEAMRSDINKAYHEIVNDAKSTANDIINAEKAKNSQLKKLADEQFGVQKSTYDKIKDQLSSVGGIVGAISVAAAAWKAVHFTEELIQSGMAAERLANSLSASLGGINQAKMAMSFLSDQSKALGTDLFTSSEGFQKLAASARGTALEGQKTRDIFSAISTASSALHLTSEQSSGALLAISQMMNKGNVQAEELRGQLGERLPGAFNMAARAMGVTTQELDKMLVHGQVVASEFLPKFARVLTEEYGQAATQSADSTSAAVNRMKNSWEQAKRDIGEILLPAVTKAAQSVNWLIQSIAPDKLTDLEKVGELESKIANLKDRMTQPGMTWVLGDDLKKAEDDLTRLQYSMAGVTLKTGEWAQGIVNLKKAEGDTFSKGDSWKSYFKEREAAYDRGAKGLSAYYAELDKQDEDAANKAAKSAEKAFKDSQQKAEEYARSLLSVSNEYAKLTLSAKEYEKLQIWQAWEKEAAKMSDVALAVRDMKLAAVDAKAHLDQLRQDALKNIAEKPENYANTDMFAGAKDAQKRAQELLDVEEQTNKALIELSENAAKQVEKAWSGYFLDVITGKMNSLADFWASTLNTIAKMTSDILGQIMRQSIFGLGKGETESMVSSIWNGLSGLFTASAQGNIFSGSGIGAYENSIVSSPTLFPFATGIGLMGEAGAEAILPLTRTSGGDLGVKASGAGAAPKVVINMSNQTATPMQLQQNDIHFDGEAWIISVVAKDLETDRHGLRTLMGGR